MERIYFQGNNSKVFLGGSIATARLSSTQDVGNTNTWESFSTLQGLIDNTPANGTLDLNGRFFAPLAEQTSETIDRINVDNPITITNGTIGLIEPPTWSAIGNGVYEYALLYDTYPHARFYINDPLASEHPQLATFPEATNANPAEVGADNFYDLNRFRLNYTPETMPWTVNQSDINGGGTGPISTIVISGQVKEEFESVVNANNADTFCIQMQATSNRNAGAIITAYDPDTGTISVNADPLWTNTRAVVPFTISGPSLVGTYGDYAYDPSRNVVVYKPQNGNPEKAVVPSGRFGVRLNNDGGSTYSDDIGTSGSSVLKNIDFIGGKEAGVVFLVDLGISNGLVKNCTFTDIATGCSMDNLGLGTIESCSFKWMLARGISAKPGLRIQKCEFRFTEGSSAILYQTSTDYSNTTLAESLVDSCVFELPCSTHGNAIAFYNKSVSNAVATNNLFINCYLGLICQGSGSGIASSVNPIRFVVENNCWIYNKVAGQLVAGQDGFKVVDNDFGTSPSGTWNCSVRYNSMLVDEAVFFNDSRQDNPTANSRGFLLCNFSNVNDYADSEIRVEHNVFGQITSEDSNAAYVYMKNNAQFIPVEGARGYNPFRCRQETIPPLEIDNLGSGLADVWNFTSNSTRDDVLNLSAASSDDQGRVGIRFSSFPSRSELFTIGPSWTDTFQPQSLPTAGDLGEQVGPE